jgi:hypothetical protein
MAIRSAADWGYEEGGPRPGRRDFLRSVAALAAGVVLVTGCTNHGEGLTAVRAAISSGSAISQFSILGSQGASVLDRTSVTGSVGVSAGAGSTPDTFTGGASVHVALASVVMAPEVVLGPQAVIGNVDTNQIVAPTTATIAVRAPFQAPPAAPVPSPVTAGTTAVNVPSGQTVTLISGQYGAVNVSGTLNLAGGLYQLGSIFLNDGAKLAGLASSVVKVAGTVEALDRVQVSVVAPLRAPDLRIEASGQDASGNSVVFGNDCQLQGLVVTGANFTAGDRFIESGAIGGLNVAIGHDAVLTLVSGFACASNSDCLSGGCVAGACVDNTPGFACQSTAVARSPVTPTDPFDLASDGTNLYWTDTGAGAVESATLTGASQSSLVTARPGVGGLAVDATYVYFTDAQQNTVSRVPKAGGTPEIVAAGERTPRLIASDGDLLFWTNQGTGQTDGSVRQLTKSTGELDVIADRQPAPWSITSIAGQPYWSDLQSGAVFSSTGPGAAIQTIASGLVDPAVGTGSTEPYVLSGDGRVYHFDATSQQLSPRAITATGPFSLATREPSLFWANGIADTLSEQLTTTEFPSTVWRRPGTGIPRVVRQLGGAIWFSVASSTGPSSIFNLSPNPAVAVPAGAPSCPPAAAQSPLCSQVAGAIVPFLECVVQTTNQQLVAHFGYTNADSVARRLGAGPENQFDRLDGDACQPSTFAPGTHHDVFAVGFVGEVTWVVGQHSATASQSSPVCAAGAVANTEVSP